jgi:hypothetical protein
LLNSHFRDDERNSETLRQWVWRDWVIDAYNRNVPFGQFTIEQLAGDLLANATPQQRLATGFNRNHGVTIEGGVIDEEYRTEYVMDRLVTTSTTWRGLTVGCARCHDHKFDPLSQKGKSKSCYRRLQPFERRLDARISQATATIFFLHQATVFLTK